MELENLKRLFPSGMPLPLRSNTGNAGNATSTTSGPASTTTLDASTSSAASISGKATVIERISQQNRERL